MVNKMPFQDFLTLIAMLLGHVNYMQGSKDSNYFNICKKNVHDQIFLVLWGCRMHVLVKLHLKRVGVISKSFKMDGI